MKLDYETDRLYLSLTEYKQFTRVALLAKRLAKDRESEEKTELIQLAANIAKMAERYYDGKAKKVGSNRGQV